jgi:hypothetical protein
MGWMTENCCWNVKVTGIAAARKSYSEWPARETVSSKNRLRSMNSNPETDC